MVLDLVVVNPISKFEHALAAKNFGCVSPRLRFHRG